MNNFIGKDGFYWWLGVVEDRNDPLNLGRVRVRIFGHHTDNLSDLPTNKLPWALPVLPPNGTMISDTPLVGDYAFGFFSDNMSFQAPMILGVFPGIPKNGPNTSKGFSEGNFYPIGEPTTSRLYRNEKISETSIGFHNANLDTNVPTASGGSWSEPASQYATEPPHNHVMQTEAGHVLEFDDTPGAERIHLNHKANTFFEISPDGSKVTKVSGKNYEIYLSDNNVHIKGQCNITVDGNTNLYVKGNLTQKVGGNVMQEIGGNVTQEIGGDVTQTVQGDVNQNISGNVIEKVTGVVDLTISGALGFSARAYSFNLTGDVNVNGKITATKDIIGGGISLDNHVHGGVSSGTKKTLTPE